MIEKRTKQSDVQDLIPIEKIVGEKIILKNKNKISIYKVEPTNFKLKTSLEQQAILEGYRLFLKRCNFDIQIIVQTQKKDLNQYIKNMKSQIKDNNVRESLNDYIEFLKEVINEKQVVSKSFYIVVETTKLNDEDIFAKMKEGLSLCDNEIKKCDYIESIKVIKNYLNR